MNAAEIPNGASGTNNYTISPYVAEKHQSNQRSKLSGLIPKLPSHKISDYFVYDAPIMAHQKLHRGSRSSSLNVLAAHSAGSVP